MSKTKWLTFSFTTSRIHLSLGCESFTQSVSFVLLTLLLIISIFPIVHSQQQQQTKSNHHGEAHFHDDEIHEKDFSMFGNFYLQNAFQNLTDPKYYQNYIR